MVRCFILVLLMVMSITAGFASEDFATRGSQNDVPKIDTILAYFNFGKPAFTVRTDVLSDKIGAHNLTSGGTLTQARSLGEGFWDYALIPPSGLSDSLYFARKKDTLINTGAVLIIKDFAGEARLGRLKQGKVSVSQLLSTSGLRVRIAHMDCDGTYPVLASRIRHLRNGRELGVYSKGHFQCGVRPQTGDVVLIDRIIYNTPVGKRSHQMLRYEVK